MKLLRLCLAAGLAAAILAPLGTPAAAAPAAQAANLLTNGGFETAGSGSGTANWTHWWSESPKPADGSFNYAFKPSWNQESLSGGAASAFIYAGNSSQRIVNNWDPWWAGVRQVATAPAGATVRLTVYARAWATNGSWPASSDTSTPIRIQVGLEPSGSDNQFGGTVVWSGAIAPHDSWQTVSVQATVGAAGKVGVFISADYRGSSRQFMSAVFDEATLTVVSAGAAPTSAPGGGTAPTAAPAAPVATAVPFVKPTPGPDGNIVYVVQPGDSAWGIAANAGLTLQQLTDLNGGINLNFISVGQRLVIGQGQPSTPPTATAAPEPTQDPNAPTAVPEPTATTAGEPTAAPTAAPPGGKLCARIYEDQNGNALREEGETSVAGGNLTVIDAASGAPVQAYTTQAGEEEHCFEGITPGVYTLAAAPPAGYNATTSANARLEVQADASVNIEFGAQKSGGGAVQPAPADDGSAMRVALFGAAGIMLILLAAGIAGFLMLRRR
ncbi:MAG: LysM peptidoglycan-binding domain-containing protein [Anaerolineales bacterium]|nr:LysM peptidoglycan-binding domain-containing protein [Anaerolineales bacterium]